MISFVLLINAELLRIVLAITYPIANRVLDFVDYLLNGPTKPLPAIDDKILLLSATELAEKIRKRELKCKDVMRAYIQRSQLVHPYINAVTDARYVDALQDAIAVDRFLDSREKTEDQIAKETPLLGVPFSCKEVLGIKGLLQTAGLVKAKNHVAEVDGDSGALYRKAGAIPVTVTNVPEICMWWDSSNHVFGKTKNPYDNSRIPGGSTGGEAALLTSAGAIIGIGTDIGGSIRIPSAFCGIYGHKPSSGIVSNWGTFPYCHMTPDKNDTRPTEKFIGTGPMCRYAKDLPLLMKVLSGNDSRIKLDEKVDFRKVKVYYMKEIPGMFNGSRPDIKKAIIKAAKHFEEKFDIKTTPLCFEEMKYSLPMWMAKCKEIGAPPLHTSLAYGKSSINIWWEIFKSLFRLSDHTFPLLFLSVASKSGKGKNYYNALEKYKSLEKKFEDIFQENAIFLFPTHPEPPPHFLTTIPKVKNGGHTCIFNILGLPSTAVPAGLSDGLPISIQVISGQFMDHLTIAAAQELDKVFGGWKSPCPIQL
ncbi:fatty-acid amide hydrolase 2 [Trichonephila clavata]|uniref:Fatty-acid amide hydrolase 2 n=1 Tax=Trichonephila clavata TaxID=2740835 RepID=A0A8X6KB70_TRICU|nr:fatty-acid amide hydrolase 2 [Trichonephila clavata]